VITNGDGGRASAPRTISLFASSPARFYDFFDSGSAKWQPDGEWAIATLPDGITRPLLWIKNWDFNWQDVYRYKSPVRLPAGTTVTMKWVYDNSVDNPVNPTQPPRLVTFGQRTSDEMSELWFQVYPRRGADRDRLVKSLAASIQDQNLAGYEAMIAANPDSVNVRT